MTKKSNFKKHLLASASVLAIGAFAAGQASAGVTNITAAQDLTNADTNYTFSGATGYTASDTANLAFGDVTNDYIFDFNNGVAGTGTLTLGGVTTTDAAITYTIANSDSLLTTSVNSTNIFTLATPATVTNAAGTGVMFLVTKNHGGINIYGTTSTNNAINLMTIGTGANGSVVFGNGTTAGSSTVVTGSAVKVAGGAMAGSITIAAAYSVTGGAAAAGLINIDNALTGDITNGGTMTTTAGGQAIDIAANVVGAVKNNKSIVGAGAGVAVGGITISAGTPTIRDGLTNSSAGTIALSAAGVGINVLSALTVTSNTTTSAGAIVNAGTITSVAGVGINLGAAVTNSAGTWVASTGAFAGTYNSGSISDTTGAAVRMLTASTNTLTNAAGATLANTTGATFTGAVHLTESNLGIYNAGSITTTTGAGIFLANSKVLTTLTNASTGVISATTGNAINLEAGSALTAITTLNNVGGTIKTTGDSAAIIWGGAGAATAINNTAGLITSGATTSTLGTIKTSGSSVGTAITNTGTISATGASGKAFYFADGGVIGAATITNGVITALTTGIINTTGTISGATSASTVATPVVAGLTATGTATGTAIDASADTTASALNLSNAGTINGDVKTGTGGTSAITLNSSNTLSGTTINGYQLNGNISLGSATDVVNFNQGAGASQAFAGSISGSSATQKGVITAVTGTTTMINTNTAAGTTAQIKGASLVVSSGATLYIKGAVPTSTLSTVLTTTDTSGLTTVGGVLQIGARVTHTSTGAITENSGGTVTIDFTNIGASTTTALTNTLNGVLASASTVTFNGGASTLVNGVSTSGTGAAAGAISINYTNASGAYQIAGTKTGVVTGTAITYANGNLNTSAVSTAMGSTVATGYILGDNSYVLKFVGYLPTATSMSVDVIRENTYQSSSAVTNTRAVGTALEAIGTAGTGNTALTTILATLDSTAVASTVEANLKTLDATTQTSGATTQAAVMVQDAAIGTVESRMETARAEMSGTGVATGSRMNNNGVWGEVFGSAIDQNDRKGVSGYQADVGGFAIGADTALNAQTRLGAAFAYGNTDANGTRNSVDVDSFQGSVYGTYDMGKVYYEGLAAFTYNSYDSSRTLFDNTVAKASFDGQQYSAKGTAGYKVDVNGGLKVTPFVSAQYTFLTQDKYSETGSNANLHVNSDDINIFKTGLGTKLAYPVVDGGVTYTPRLSAAWYYDLVGDEASTTSNFTSAAATTFVSKGAEIAQSEFKLGAGLDVLAQDNVTVSLDYNWNSKEDFNAHTGELKARFEF